ncbi:hypothetical protein B0H11DRAFT_1938394 [Mycena galericulata]|nr:hypothetical protein B0H11DRAFT_1938394 [Mycena galericulata]
MATPEVSTLFHAADADITIQSSDGVLFKLHRKNLQVHSVVFADAESATLPENGSEVVQLSETSEILDLLFQFMYPQLQPDLKTLEFRLLAGMAEAAEKYMVFSALTLCRMNMKDCIVQNALEVLNYAVKHGHDFADEAARQSMNSGVADAMKLLDPDTFTTWILSRIVPSSINHSALQLDVFSAYIDYNYISDCHFFAAALGRHRGGGMYGRWRE